MKKIYIISLLIILLTGSLIINGIIILGLVKPREVQVIQKQASPIIISHNLIPVAQEECEAGEGQFYTLLEQNGNLSIDYYDSDANPNHRETLISSGALKARPKDFENGWVFEDSTFLFNNCRFVLTTQRYNFTTGGGYRRETWLYERGSKKMTHIKNATYSLSSISANYQLVLLQDFTNDKNAFQWLQQDGSRKLIPSFTFNNKTLDPSTGLLDGRQAVVTNAGGIFFLAEEQIPNQEDPDDTKIAYTYYYYDGTLVHKVFTVPNDDSPGEPFFDEKSNTFVVLSRSSEEGRIDSFTTPRYTVQYQYHLE